MRSHYFFLWLLCAILASLGAGKLRAAPAAIVENVDKHVKSAALMDYLSRGQSLDLGAAGWIEIGYFASCTHEHIVGGVVSVGDARSEVQGGRVERHQVVCDAANIVVDDRQSVRAAGSAERSTAQPGTSIPIVAGAELRLHGTSPLVVAKGGGEVVISRLADANDRQIVALDRRGLYDFAQAGRSLKPGAVYRATLGQREVLFRIDRDARDGRTDLLGRLILFAPELP